MALPGWFFCLASAALFLPSTADASGWPSTANGDEFCDFYANSAISQVDTAVKGQCGFTGPRWTADKEEHRNWCLGLNGDQTWPKSEKEARRVAIEKCWLWCRDYARKAVAAANKNYDLNCGFEGPRWTLEKDDHIIWCQFEANHDLADAETAARSAALDECIREKGEIVPKPPSGLSPSMPPAPPAIESVPKPPGGTGKFIQQMKP